MKNQSRRSERPGVSRRWRGGQWRNLALLAWCLLSVLPAHAERADRDKPVNLEADRVNVDDAKQIATFEGNVILTQGTLVIRGDRMVVQQDADGFKNGVAYGNLASFRQKREGYDEYIDGYAERIEYDSKAEKLQMFNRAYLKKATTTCAAITFPTTRPPSFSASSAAASRPRHPAIRKAACAR